jgi:hypothetical protein
MIGNPTDNSIGSSNNDNNLMIGIHFVSEDNFCYKTISLSEDGKNIKGVKVTSDKNKEEKWFPVEYVQEKCK